MAGTVIHERETVVSDLLGHSPIAITGDIYGHLSPDVAREAVEMLGDAFDQ